MRFGMLMLQHAVRCLNCGQPVLRADLLQNSGPASQLCPRLCGRCSPHISVHVPAEAKPVDSSYAFMPVLSFVDDPLSVLSPSAAGNFSRLQILDLGSLVIDTTIKAGDTLSLPSGWEFPSLVHLNLSNISLTGGLPAGVCGGCVGTHAREHVLVRARVKERVP